MIEWDNEIPREDVMEHGINTIICPWTRDTVTKKSMGIGHKELLVWGRLMSRSDRPEGNASSKEKRGVKGVKADGRTRILAQVGIP